MPERINLSQKKVHQSAGTCSGSPYNYGEEQLCHYTLLRTKTTNGE